MIEPLRFRAIGAGVFICGFPPRGCDRPGASCHPPPTASNRWTAALPLCNRQPSHAHHLRFAQKRGMAKKVSDEYVMPLCALAMGISIEAHRKGLVGKAEDRSAAIPDKLWRNHDS
jgi:hypothetical protein